MFRTIVLAVELTDRNSSATRLGLDTPDEGRRTGGLKILMAMSTFKAVWRRSWASIQAVEDPIPLARGQRRQACVGILDLISNRTVAERTGFGLVASRFHASSVERFTNKKRENPIPTVNDSRRPVARH